MARTTIRAMETTPAAAIAAAFGRPAMHQRPQRPGVVQSMMKKPSTTSAIPTIVYSAMAANAVTDGRPVSGFQTGSQPSKLLRGS